MKYADAHTHIFPPEVVKNRELFFEGEPAFKLLYDNPKSKLIEAENLLAEMEKNKVDFSVTFGFPWQSPDHCKRCNDYVLNEAQKNQERLVPFATLPCCNVDNALSELERCAAGGAAGIGELSFYGTNDADCDINTWQSEVGLLAASLGLPTLWHVTEDVGHDYPGKGGMFPKQAAALAGQLCGATIILAHWGGGLPFYELMPEVKSACTKVYYDTAASPYLYDANIYSAAAMVIGADRILFGSDFPLISQGRYIKQIKSLGLPDDQVEQILGGNLRRLLERA